MQEMEISLKDLAKRVFQQWRLLLIGMIACAIIATVVGGVISVQKVEAFFSVKNVIIGVVLGAFLVVMYVMVAYVLSGKLRSASDIAQGFGVSVIGVLTCDNKKQRQFAAVDDMINNWFREGKIISWKTNIQIIGTDISLAAQKHGIENLYFTGNVSKEVVAAIEKSIKTLKENDEIDICFDELAIYSPDGLKNMLNADGVVLFEQIGKSTFVDIEKELKYCERYNIPVLGCVVVE